jgi:hypothetical protein
MGCRSLLAACALLAAFAPAANADGLFLSTCTYSHSSFNDPIVHPHHAGHSHRHDFFGNTGTDAHSTSKRLRRGSTTCSQPGDTAAYWAPSLFKGRRIVKPRRVLAWYFSDNSRKVRAFPAGLKIIAGDAHAKSFQSPGIVNWSCEGRFGRGRGRAADHFGGELPKNNIPSCQDRGVNLRISFPSCWDGKRRDSRDHKSHMAYEVWRGWGRTSGCPSSHPVSVPSLVLDISYPIRNGYKVKLASGKQRTAHADFFNGWRIGEMKRLTRTCLRKSRRCLPRWWG